MKSLIIDNFDSFTYNIYHLLAEVNGINPVVITNNKLSWQEITELNFDNIILSPGAGNPENVSDFGVCGEVLLKANIPVLGICLGHQGLGYFYGAKVKRSIEPFHGRISEIYHQQNSLFCNIPSPFQVVRYHSLIIDYPLPSDLEVIATTNDNLIMGIRHKFKPFWGVQFHPESICSQYGKELLINFYNLTQIYHNYNDKIHNNCQDRSSFLKPKLLPKISIINTDNCQEKKIDKQYQIYSKKLNIFVDSAQVFEEFYSKSTHNFWLDSSMVEKGLSRFSYMGDAQGENSFLVVYNVNKQQIKVTKKNEINTFTGDIFTFLQDILEHYRCDNQDLPCNFNGGLIGYFGYELKALCGYENKHQSSLPDAQFIFVDRAMIFDHFCQEIYLIFLDKVNQEITANKWFDDIENKLKLLNPKKTIYSNNNQQNDRYQLSRNSEEYLQNIETCLEKIRQGESYEICLTNHLHLPTIKEPLNYYLQLRKANPTPYSAFLKFGKMTIVCSSPERFLLLDKDGILESKPIKGTIKRGKTQTEDIQLKNALKFSEKEQAENLMIVDLLRHDLGRVCEVGTVTVPKLMSIETYSTVHQMVSTVKGKIKKGVTAIDCIKSCFPGGSMTGAPKKRTLEIIDELETQARGIYSGSIGFLGLNGTMDLNIVIRTAIITEDESSIGVGGAITILSDKHKEFEEIILKAQALLQLTINN